MYSSAKNVGVARSQPRARRSRKLTPTRAARRGAARVPARARSARGASARSAVRAATDTVSLSARRPRPLAAPAQPWGFVSAVAVAAKAETGRREAAWPIPSVHSSARLDAVLLLRRLVGDEEAAMRALEAEVPLGLAEQRGVERLAAVRADDREGIAGVGRSRHPRPRLACRR